jgi:solute:Na+ symporter, SSS family
VVFGIALYAYFTFVHAPFDLHYIHLMLVTLIATVTFALALNRFGFGRKASLVAFWKEDVLAEDTSKSQV